MGQSDTARSQVRYVEENNGWGQAMVSGRTYKNFRCTGETLKHVKKTIVSKEIRSDRQIPSTTKVGRMNQGGMNFELSWGALDDFLEGALHSRWLTSTVTGSSNIAFDSSAKTITKAGETFLSKFRVGQIINVTGAPTGANNGYKTITALTDTVITCSGDTFATESGTSATIRGSILRNGVTEISYKLERENADVTQFFLYEGMEIGTFDLDFTAEEQVTGSLGWMGRNATRSGATAHADGSLVAAPTGDVFNATDNVGSIKVAGSTLATALRQIKLAVNNNLRGRPALGTEFSVSLGRGRCNVSLDLLAYFQDGTLYDIFDDHTPVSLHWRATDAAGSAYLFTVPRLRINDDDTNNPAADQDAMEPQKCQAERDPTTDCTLQIDKLAA